jgi:serine/threonine protein kinase
MFVQFKYSKWGSSSSDDTEQPFSLPLPEQQLRHYLNREKKEKKIVQLPDDILKLREYRRQEATNALGDAAVDSLKNRLKTSAGGGRKKKGRAEDLPQGCEPAEWQKLSFPNCNEIHEIDLRQAIRKRLSDNLALSNKQEEISEADTFGYVGSGLWRNVWKVDPRGEVVNTAAHEGESVAPSVLKMMKAQHECDERNLDRHRRDALVMERLTAAPGVVSMYGFCGNTVLTEFVGHGLDEIIYKDKRFETTVDKVLHAQKVDDSLYPTRETKIGRLRLAFQVAHGLAALHNIPGGPIVHADIQAKQFLIDPVLGVRLNDFNRCRFVTRTSETHEPCPFKIPSAPGSNRSPEEYENVELSEKLDIYSVAHVLYGILTGEKVWAMEANKQVKNRVKGGQIPPIDSKYRTSDPELVSLVERAYVYDPKKRISATELETELEALLVAEERRSKGKDSIRRHLRELP